LIGLEPMLQSSFAIEITFEICFYMYMDS
jgi:hypothetical protein